MKESINSNQYSNPHNSNSIKTHTRLASSLKGWLLVLLLILSVSYITAYCNGNYTSGDWNITNTLTCSNEAINVTGNINIISSGEQQDSYFNDGYYDLSNNTGTTYTTYPDIAVYYFNDNEYDLNNNLGIITDAIPDLIDNETGYTTNWNNNAGETFKIMMNESENQLQIFTNSTSQGWGYGIDIDNNGSTGLNLGNNEGFDIAIVYNVGNPDINFGVICYNASLEDFSPLDKNGGNCNTDYNNLLGQNATVWWNTSSDNNTIEVVLNITGNWTDHKVTSVNVNTNTISHTTFKNSTAILGNISDWGTDLIDNETGYTNDWDNSPNFRFKTLMNESENMLKIYIDGYGNGNIYGIDIDGNDSTGTNSSWLGGAFTGADLIIATGYTISEGTPLVICVNSSFDGSGEGLIQLGNGAECSKNLGSDISTNVPFNVYFKRNNTNAIEIAINMSGSWVNHKISTLNFDNWNMYSTTFKNYSLIPFIAGNLTLDNVTLDISGDINSAHILNTKDSILNLGSGLYTTSGSNTNIDNTTINVINNLNNYGTFILNNSFINASYNVIDYHIMNISNSNITYNENYTQFVSYTNALTSIFNSNFYTTEPDTYFVFNIQSKNFTYDGGYLNNLAGYNVYDTGLILSYDVNYANISNIIIGANVDNQNAIGCISVNGLWNTINNLNCSQGIKINGNYNTIKNSYGGSILYISSFANTIINSTFENGYVTIDDSFFADYNNYFINDHFINMNFNEYRGIRNYFIFNNSYGQILWKTQNATSGSPITLDMDSTIYIEPNLLKVNNNILSLFNNTETTTELTFYGLNYTSDGRLYKDGIRCDTNSSLCNISYISGTLYANVSGFDNYAENFSNYTTGTAPLTTIDYMNAPTSANPTELGNTTIYVQFNASNTDNYTAINVSTAQVQLYKTGQTTITSTGCTNITDGINTITFNCTLELPYYMKDGNWTVNTSIDTTSNNTQTFTYGILSAMQVDISAIDFGGNLSTNQNDIPANDSTIITNTGNQPFTTININGQDLVGITPKATSSTVVLSSDNPASFEIGTGMNLSVGDKVEAYGVSAGIIVGNITNYGAPNPTFIDINPEYYSDSFWGSANWQIFLMERNGIKYYIPTSNFEASITNIANSGTSLVTNTDTAISGATLPVNSTEELFYFVDIPTVATQQYKTKLAWVISCS